MKQTFEWIDKTVKKQGAYPLLKQTYDRYTTQLAQIAPGTNPIDLLEFTKQLSINNY